MSHGPVTDSFQPPRRWSFAAALLVFAALTVITGVGMWVSAHFSFLQACLDRGAEPVSPAPGGAAQPALFREWPADRVPDLALMISGEEHGYLLPCGCSRPQLGGLERRYNFLQTLKDKHWPVVPVDVGDLIEDQAQRGPQALLKYQTSMKALNQMGYLGVGLGRNEMEMPLLRTLGEFPLNNPAPRVLAANLKEKDNNFASAVLSTASTGPGEAPRLGVIGVVGPTVQQGVPKQSPEVEWSATPEALTASFKELQAQKPEIIVILYQGTIDEAKSCARWLKQQPTLPRVDALVCLTREEEPSDRPDHVGDTLVISVGHKGRYVGVLGAFKGGKGGKAFDFRYQLVALGEEYETPAGKDKDNPILALMDEYARTVKNDDYLGRYPERKHPLQVQYPQATYVGSAQCKMCHAKAGAVWDKHPHSDAYQKLVAAQRPALRQFDGECIVCHTVGFGFESGFRSEAKTPNLTDVGCESCHGPGSLHAAQGGKTPAALLALMNPYKVPADETPEQEKRRLSLIDQSCQKCHDTDNDVHWNFAKKWPLVVHHSK
jgi:hypothetical protein